MSEFTPLLPIFMTLGLVLLALQEMQAMQVFVTTAAGKTITLAVERGDTIRRIKAKIAVQEGCPLDAQRLVYANKVLEDDLSVADYRIKGYSTLQMVG